MKLSDFDYHLPKNLIAQKPVKPRDYSRLLIVTLRGGATNAAHSNNIEINHKHFYNITDYLRAGDVLVLNNSKVMPARLIGKKSETGGKIEVFLLSGKIPQPPLSRGLLWQCLLGGRGRKENLIIKFEKNLKAKVLKNNGDGTWLVKFNKPYKKMIEIVYQVGQTPLPPYIKRSSKFKAQSSKLKSDILNYQTIYADDKKIGSVAAPTAGFHFTPGLLKKIKNKGIQIEFITLHIGLGTFAPVKTEDITKHKMHAEHVEIKKDVAQRILKAKREGRRIIAVGTTTTRALESLFYKCHCEKPRILRGDEAILLIALPEIASSREGGTRNDNLFIKNYNGLTDIFIYPGYKFKIVDALITNFHLPKSTLLMLVSAFVGQKNIKKIYQKAIKKKYRFYSYGDAMFIYPHT